MLNYISKKIDKALSWFYTWKIYGPQCLDYEPDCPGCKAWKKHNEFFN